MGRLRLRIQPFLPIQVLIMSSLGYLLPWCALGEANYANLNATFPGVGYVGYFKLFGMPHNLGYMLIKIILRFYKKYNGTKFISL